MRARLGLLRAIGAGLVLGCAGVGNLIGCAGGAHHGGGTVAADAGLPCDVVQALSLCVNCHSDPPVGTAVGSLYTYADLMAPAPTDPSMTMAEMAVFRMQDTASPMPPAQIGQPATTMQIQTMMGWLAAGSPTGTCGPPPDTTFAGDPVCASGNFYQGDGGAGGSPGLPCPECEPADAGLLAPLGGTVFAAGKVPDGCLPPASVDMTKASVLVTDANGTEYTLPVGPDGNFRSDASQEIVFPFTAKVTYMGNTRSMLWRQSTGDCNSCHTATGANSAPGRITLPN